MVFIVKVAYNMDVKMAKFTKIYGGNTKSDLERSFSVRMNADE